MVTGLNALETQIAAKKKLLFSHSLYDRLDDINAVGCFMSHHVFVVWDFMNLLSYLQSTYTSTVVPWSPPKYPDIARLINEIKLEEESDIINGQITSHFEYYMFVMKRMNISVAQIEGLVGDIGTVDYQTLVTTRRVPEAVRPFLLATYHAIATGPVGAAASLTFGRETMVPTMFSKILESANVPPEFKTYLERHVTLDGESHGRLSLKLMSKICGTDPQLWQQAADVAEAALDARIALYTCIESRINNGQ